MMRRPFGILLLASGILAASDVPPPGRDGALVGARPAPRPVVRASSAFQLFGPNRYRILLAGNRVACEFDNIGEQCGSFSDLIYGGAWPAGSMDSYIFNGGLQVAAIIPGSRTAFAWAGDTVGAYFYDARGAQTIGVGVTGIYDSRSSEDLAKWPSPAYLRDPALFDVSLLGRKVASDQDSWVRYWDVASYPGWGRPHAMGVVVDQRTLAWNGPQVNRDILFVIHRLINVTARDRARYAGLAEAGYTAGDIDELVRLGEVFHVRAESLGVAVPDSGFTWSNLYVGFGQDPDVGQGTSTNYATAVLPFATAIGYHAAFASPSWAYPADIFQPPFAAAPGLAGLKLLSGPDGPVTGSTAVRMFTTFTNGGLFPDRLGVAALWRLMSDHLLPGDGQCNAPAGRPLCYVGQAVQDARWHLASGPWRDVPAGGTVVFAIAYVFAAPVASALQTDGLGHALGSTAFDLKPGFPATGAQLAAGADTVKQIERVAGWISHQDANGDGDIQAREVRTVPYSLLHKAAAAQAFFDAKLLAPSAPAAPRFFVLPGDGQVTVVWEPSATETTGDPYFTVASDPLSPLYDPNFRRFDVEGYRVWRGRSLASMEVVVQLDHRGTAIVDRTGQVFGSYEEVGQCAPDLGIVTDCRADFLHGGSRSVQLLGDVVQVPPQGRVVLANGHVVVLRADTAVTGGASGRPWLQDNGVPFAFVDAGLQDNTTYLYAVTAFDVNSITEGPSSLESEVVAKSVAPRIASSTVHRASIVSTLLGGDGSPLDLRRPFPAIDSNDGTFSGPIPPASGGALDLSGLVPELLTVGETVLRIDSVSPGFARNWASPQPRVHFTVLTGRDTVRGSVEVPVENADLTYQGSTTYEIGARLIAYDSAQARRFGVPLGPDSRMLLGYVGRASTLFFTSPGVARVAYLHSMSSATRYLAHSRWYDDGAAEPPQPTITPFASQTHTNGMLAGVSAIFSPLPYRLPRSGGAAARAIPSTRYRDFVEATVAAWYPADIVVRWGIGGQVTVRDSTHRVDLPFKAAVQPGYGFFDAAAVTAAGVTSAQLADGSSGVTFDPAVVSYYDLRTLRPVCSLPTSTVPCVALQPTARLQPVDVTNDGVPDGNGIGILINGEPFFMLLNALPAPGTVWHLRAVGGSYLNASCTPALPYSGDLLPGSEPTSCRNYLYQPPWIRPAYVPGLRYAITVTRRSVADSTGADLALVHTVPDPLYVTNANGTTPQIRFVNLPEQAIIRIYSASGILVTVLTHNDPTEGGETVWDVTNRSGRPVASGVYFYHVETPDQRTRIGRFTIVQQAWP